jgi:hypothetical protein
VAIETQKTNGQTLSSSYGRLSGIPEETQNYRRRVLSLLIFGNPGDAESEYYAAPGTSYEGWQYLLRVCLPVRSYLETGDALYLSTGAADVWLGVMTPQGDCAEDAMPAEYQNAARRQQEAEWFESKVSR